jgi:hypothetical protein
MPRPCRPIDEFYRLNRDAYAVLTDRDTLHGIGHRLMPGCRIVPLPHAGALRGDRKLARSDIYDRRPAAGMAAVYW